MEGNSSNAGGEMEWQSDHTISNPSQMLSQQLVEMKQDLNDGIASVIKMLDIKQQPCVQVTPDHIEQIIRKTLKELDASDLQHNQPLSRRLSSSTPAPSAPSQSQSLPESAVPGDKTEIDDLRLRLGIADSEIAALKGQLKVAETEASQLRDIIIPSDEEVILDDKLKQMFADIRSTVQVLVVKHYHNYGKSRYYKTEKNRALFDKINSYPSERQQEAIRAEFFHHLNAWFFSSQFRCFGLGKGYRALNQCLKTTEEDFAQAFRSRYPNVYCTEPYNKELIEWRHATFKCADLLKDTSDETSRYQEFLEDYFKPAQTDDPKAVLLIRKSLKKICEKSYELGILMRRARDVFQVYDIDQHRDLADCENEVEVMSHDTEYRASYGTKSIDACLFGGLKKISRDYPSHPIFLEKAHVSTRCSRYSR
ncbi:hypothetical protein FSARC_10093 [Fusarium sarcochroum]|uniref:Uncharacterized protein n=1 Tax=Fusarium sarcochroum TaxID=1208366 RepID=A0A8H4TQ35_9HYPO|nr:hypothetical protein FSARC_10093 [Fusarium sarcochroum]